MSDHLPPKYRPSCVWIKDNWHKGEELKRKLDYPNSFLEILKAGECSTWYFSKSLTKGKRCFRQLFCSFKLFTNSKHFPTFNVTFSFPFFSLLLFEDLNIKKKNELNIVTLSFFLFFFKMPDLLQQYQCRNVWFPKKNNR